MEVAKLSVNETEEKATELASQIGYEASAIKSTIKEVVSQQADAFQEMGTNLTWGPSEFV